MTERSALRLEGIGVRYDQSEEGTLLQRSPEPVVALEDVGLEIARGECLGLIGESGSGKSTLGRVVVQLVRPTSGRVVFDGVDLTALTPRALRPYRPRLQIVFQDPSESLDPRFTIEDVITEPLRLLHVGTRRERRERAARMLEHVGLPREALRHRPTQYSGGQRQRIAIARALVTEPEVVVLDEPTSGVDVSMQARILNLLRDLQRSLGLTYLFITHDVGAVSYLAQRVAVIYRGRIVEVAPTRELVAVPRHPYTVALLDALPRLIRGETTIPGGDEPPPSLRPPPLPLIRGGCAYAPHCPRRGEDCLKTVPPLRTIAPGHDLACHHPHGKLP